jgi:hypothetical protein
VTTDDVARHFTELPENRPGRFDEMAGAVFAYQQAHCAVYKRYCTLVADRQRHPDARNPTNAGSASEETFTLRRKPPFLPVDAFKHVPVATFPSEQAQTVFESSGTGRGIPSKHYVYDLRIYERAVTANFRRIFGEGPFLIIAYLPEYAERSSLVYMVRHLIKSFGEEGSGFFLDDTGILENAADRADAEGLRLMVIGAAFGLIDLLDRRKRELPGDTLVVETGGMKTYTREITRDVLHNRLAAGFGIDRTQVISEYGMCELMSQCYTQGGETFFPPPWMRFTVVDPFDASSDLPKGVSGALAVIDLANMYSCSFLLTGDRAVRQGSGFRLLGRLSGAELRGCNFLLEDA